MVKDPHKRELGIRGEQMAADFLLQKGYQIIARNVRLGRLGEIDVLARHGKCVVFVEVKTRASLALGYPEEAITPAKLARMYRLAEAYVARHGWSGEYRVDVIAITLDPPHVEHLEAVG